MKKEKMKDKEILKEETELLELQKKYEKGIILEEQLTEQEKENLEKLYEKQISLLEKRYLVYQEKLILYKNKILEIREKINLKK